MEHTASYTQVLMYKLFNKVIYVLLFLIIISVISWQWFTKMHQHSVLTEQYLAAPKIDDFYFLDFRLFSENLRPKEKYRVAQVVDITGDVITLLYSDFFYYNQNMIEDSFRFGHLRYKDYFQPKRYDFTLKQLNAMYNSGAIYMAKRTVQGRLVGNTVKPDKTVYQSKLFVAGKRENNVGLAFLLEKNLETHAEFAFENFSRSAELGYPQGQLNLAEMYVNGQYVEKDLTRALYWFNQAALQSYKPAILKYDIVCKQVEHCDLYDFYQNLINSGVNVKVRSLGVKLTP